MSIQVINQVWNTPCKTHTQKLVLIALADNSNDQRVCWPSIDYLARRCDLSRQGVMNQIEFLLKAKLLKVKKSDGRVNVYELFPNQSTPLTGSKSPVHAVDPSTALTSPVNPVDPHQSTALTPPVHAVDPNRKEPPVEPPRTISKTYSPESRVALHYLNEKSGRHYRESESSLSVIQARLSEPEVDIEGVKMMIDRQCAMWIGDKMAEYLRPETLFGKQKFEGYYAGRDQPVIQYNANGKKIVKPKDDETF
jgi:uncharacterized phage protein (TIGR02220 family)